jgi:hypothetical protein
MRCSRWGCEEDEKRATGTAAAGTCCDLGRCHADRGGEDRRRWSSERPGLGRSSKCSLTGRAAERPAAETAPAAQ